MKWLLRTVIAVAALIALLAAAAFLLPREVSVARSVFVEAPPEQVYPHLVSLRRQTEWSPWIEEGDPVEIVYSGPEAGVGSRMEWQSADPAIGSGAQEIVAVEPGERVDTALDFGEMGMADASLVVAPRDGGSEVTWTLETDLGNSPVYRWMGLMLDAWVGTDYEIGLGRLKAQVEG